MNTNGIFSSKTNKWETPQWLFDRLNQIFCFELDACADESNHKCERYFSESEDGLKQSWGGAEHFAIHLTEGKSPNGFKRPAKQFWMISPVL